MYIYIYIYIYIYLYIYSESVLSSKRVYFKIDNNKQFIIGRTTVLFIPFLNNKSPLVLRFLKKKKTFLLQN